MNFLYPFPFQLHNQKFFGDTDEQSTSPLPPNKTELGHTANEFIFLAQARAHESCLPVRTLGSGSSRLCFWGWYPKKLKLRKLEKEPADQQRASCEHSGVVFEVLPQKEVLRLWMFCIKTLFYCFHTVWLQIPSKNLVVKTFGVWDCEERAPKLYWNRKIETQTEVEIFFFNSSFHPFYIFYLVLFLLLSSFAPLSLFIPPITLFSLVWSSDFSVSS